MSDDAILDQEYSKAEAVRTAGPRAVIALAPVELESFFPGRRQADLRQLLPDAAWVDPSHMTVPQWHERLKEIRPDVLVTAWQTPCLPSDCDGLRYVCHLAGSVRFLVPRELIVRGLRVTNWGGICAPLVAEHALLMMLATLRSLPRWAEAMSAEFSHAAKNGLHLRSLAKRRVGIHGFGQVARALVGMLEPFDCEIHAYSAGVPHEFMTAHGVRPAASLRELAAGVEVLVTCEALTDQTRHSIDRDVLTALEPGGVFVNVGRGAVVDERALVAVAAERALRVASDVFATEPLPADSPMRGVPGALYSPHVAGATSDLYPACGDLALANLQRFLGELPLTEVVTLDLYDRST